MESILADIPTHKGPSGFSPYIDPAQPIEEPPEAKEETHVLDNGLPVQGADSEDSHDEPQEDSADYSKAVAAEEELPAVETQPLAPAPEAHTEVIYNQVEGPKVEVVSVKDVVQKIIVHLSPDNILEINCEY